MKLKILHIVGGHFSGGAFKGAYILHENLKKLKVKSKIINDEIKNKKVINEKDFGYINDNLYLKLLHFIFVSIEKLIKFIFLSKKRSSFTLGLFGFDITKSKFYKKADLIHFHWFGDGFIKLKTLNKIKKPIVWTMRDMWCFTGGPHYISDYVNYEKTLLSKYIKEHKKKNFNKNIQFIAISDWLKRKAKSSYVLKNSNVKRIYNNVDHKQFQPVKKSFARLKLKIFTKKKIILFGAENPQNTRKGWNLLLDTIKKLNKDDYYLIIFGKFWSERLIRDTGIQYKSFGYIEDKKILSYIYSCADVFLAISNEEAFGKTWAESLLCNTPLICFKNSSTSEIIQHKINGYVCSKKDSKHLKMAIEWMLSSKRKKRMEKNFRELCKIFKPEYIAKQYINIYKSLIQK